MHTDRAVRPSALLDHFRCHSQGPTGDLGRVEAVRICGYLISVMEREPIGM